MRYLLVCALALLALTTTALAHGSCYRGPSPGQVPPGQRIPRDSPVPPTMDSTSRLSTWEWWWALNKEEFLYPGAALFAAAPGTVGDADRAVVESVYRALKAALDAKMTCPSRSRVALAAGAVAASRGGAPKDLLDRIRELSRDKKQQTVVQACSAIALGMTGMNGPTALAPLCDSVLDAKTKSPVRGAAALALGLVFHASPEGADELQEVACTLETASRSSGETLRTCALVAMGLNGSPNGLEFVKTVLRDELDGRAPRPLEDRSLSLVVNGLGKFADFGSADGSAEAVRVLRRLATGSWKRSRRAAIAALGRWGSLAGLEEQTVEEAVVALRTAGKCGDPVAADLALLSLARIGAATEWKAIRERVASCLAEALTGAESGAAPYAALSLGIFGRSPSLDGDRRSAIAARLRTEFEGLLSGPLGNGTGGNEPQPPPEGPITPTPPGRQSAPTPPADPSPPPPPAIEGSVVGAYAVALGLIGDEKAVFLLLRTLADSQAHPRLRGYSAVALGMLRSAPGVPAIRDIVSASEDSELTVLCCIGAGLAGDSEVRPVIEARAANAKLTSKARAVAIRSVGKLGDRAAIPALLEILTDKGSNDVLRSTAAIAIADLYDRDGALVLTRLTRDLNACARNSAFDLILSVF